MTRTIVGENLADADVVRRRRHSRHRLLQDVTIHSHGRPLVNGVSFEISEGGTSVVTTTKLEVGETVELFLFAFQIMATAVVRRNSGAMYGLEFVGLKNDDRLQIGHRCESLPPFVTMLDI